MKVIIHQPSKNAMQSGRAKSKRRWELAFEKSGRQSVEPLNGWVSQSDMTQQLDLSFDTREQAVDYARKHGLEYEILPSRRRVIKPKSYASNYRWDKVGA